MITWVSLYCVLGSGDLPSNGTRSDNFGKL